VHRETAVTIDSIPSLRAMPAVPSTSELDSAIDDFDERRTVDDIVAEMNALNAAGRAVRNQERPEEAKRMVAEVFTVRQDLPPFLAEDYAIHCAMAKIVGADVTPFLVPAAPDDEATWTTFTVRTVLNAWTLWAAGSIPEALSSLQRFRDRQYREETVTTRKGGVNLMSLYFWAGGIEALARGERSEAMRLWNRSLELAATHGTSSSPLIQWTFVASFFPV
jgi:hypothetical protein